MTVFETCLAVPESIDSDAHLDPIVYDIVGHGKCQIGGSYNVATDSISIYLEGPSDNLYKVSVTVGSDENGTLEFKKKGRFQDKDNALLIPRSMCLVDRITKASNVWTFQPNNSKKFYKAKIKLEISQDPVATERQLNDHRGIPTPPEFVPNNFLTWPYDRCSSAHCKQPLSTNLESEKLKVTTVESKNVNSVQDVVKSESVTVRGGSVPSHLPSKEVFKIVNVDSTMEVEKQEPKNLSESEQDDPVVQSTVNPDSKLPDAEKVRLQTVESLVQNVEEVAVTESSPPSVNEVNGDHLVKLFVERNHKVFKTNRNGITKNSKIVEEIIKIFSNENQGNPLVIIKRESENTERVENDTAETINERRETIEVNEKVASIYFDSKSKADQSEVVDTNLDMDSAIKMLKNSFKRRTQFEDESEQSFESCQTTLACQSYNEMYHVDMAEVMVERKLLPVFV